MNRFPRLTAAVALTAYVTAIVAANWLTAHYSLVTVGFGLMVTAGTYAAGAALLVRDAVQEALGLRWVLVGIATGAALTALTSPALAIASATAFLLAEACDTAVYTPLRRKGWARAALLSGVAGAFVDTVVFLALAGFPLAVASVGGQLVGKAVWATALPVLVLVAVRQVRRAVPRHSVGA